MGCRRTGWGYFVLIAMLRALVGCAPAHAADEPIAIRGRLVKMVVMGAERDHSFDPGAPSQTWWYVYPTDEEEAWTALKKADHPSRAPALLLEGFVTSSEKAGRGERVDVAGTLHNGDTIRSTGVTPAPLNVFERLGAAVGLVEDDTTAEAIHDGIVHGLIVAAGWPTKPTDFTAFSEANIASTLSGVTEPDLEANSYGRLDQTFDVKVVGNVLSGEPHCRLADLQAEIISLVDPMTDFTKLQSLGTWAPAATCFGGVANLFPVLTSTADGRVPLGLHWDSSSYDIGYAGTVTLHETGHTQGGHHGRTRTDAGGVPEFGRYTFCEYCDQGTWMGQQGNRCQMRAPVKAFIGLLKPEEYTVVTRTGDYTIAALETTTLVPKAIKIPLGASASGALWLEAHAPTGTCLTKAAGKPFLTGVSAMLGQFDGGSLLLGTAGPASTGWEAIPVGGSLNALGTQITVMSVGGGTAVVHVTMGPTDPTPPTLRLDTPQTTPLFPGTTIAVTVTDPTDAQVRVTSKVWGQFDEPEQMAAPGPILVAPNLCASTITGKAQVRIRVIDRFNNETSQSWLFPFDRTACDGGTTTTTSSSSTSTSTLAPGALQAVLVSEAPDPSTMGQMVTITGAGKVNGVVVPIIEVAAHAGDGGACSRPDAAGQATLACGYPFPIGCGPTGLCRGDLAVRTAQHGWSQMIGWTHRVGTPPTSTTMASPTTSTSTTSTLISPTTSSTSSSTSSSTRIPTTTPTTSSSTSTAVTPSTLPFPCWHRRIPCNLNGVLRPDLCCSKRCGPSKKCQ